jgi:hypothetical protein
MDGGIASTLEQDLQSATDDFDQGDYLELSDEQIEHCIATGESPWPDQIHGMAKVQVLGRAPRPE